MGTFRYEGFDNFGRPKQGKLEAPSKEIAVQLLRMELKIFANNVEEDSPTPMKTVFNHEDPQYGAPRDPESSGRPVPYAHSKQAVEDMYANREPVAPSPSDIQRGAAHAPVSPPQAPRAAPVALPEAPRSFAEAQGMLGREAEAEQSLEADLAGISAALRELDFFRKASAKKGWKGLVVGKATWALFDKALPRAVETLLTEALQAEAGRHKR